MKLKKSPASKKSPTKQYLYVYGDLQDDEKEAKVVARGKLRLRKSIEGIDAAARFDEDGIVYGQRRYVSEDTLKFLDAVESPIYERVQIDTSEGPAWTFEYGRDNDVKFDKLDEIPGGNYFRFLDKLENTKLGKK